eukprot:TRINITY_DN73086_c0_g1_i1.p1 TRINITY_DN73086_c0_g1~~TRINITY_DN73086_c0_g1_i1.p1  ORF type:complete len:586 (+),score=92.18 TRINITY_DN73086_c0_g1_i1:51-1760(+)
MPLSATLQWRFSFVGFVAGALTTYTVFREDAGASSAVRGDSRDPTLQHGEAAQHKGADSRGFSGGDGSSSEASHGADPWLGREWTYQSDGEVRFRETSVYDIPRQHGFRFQGGHTAGERPVSDITQAEFDAIATEDFSRRPAGDRPLPRRGGEKRRCSQSFPRGVCVTADPPGSGQARGKGYTPFVVQKDRREPALRLKAMSHMPPKLKPMVCNEGETRRIPMEGVPGPLPVGRGSGVGGVVDNLLVVAPCWDTYGYHLWACVLGVKALLFDTGLGKEFPAPYIAVVKSGWTQHRMGSHEFWNTSTPYNPKYKPNTQWAMWGGVTDHPSKVSTLRDYVGTCFEKATVGHIPLFDTTPFHTSLLVVSLLRQLRMAPPPPVPMVGPCPTPSVLLIERKANYHIQNVKTLEALSQGMLGPDAVVRTVRMEDHSFAEQVKLAASSRIMVGTHGNGMTWCAFVPRGGSLIEIWGTYPYNGNYLSMARRSGLRYIPISLHQRGCGKRCDVSVPEVDFRTALDRAVAHYQNVSCAGCWYDPDYLALAWEEHQYATKKKKRKNKGMGSPTYIDSSSL